jgi:hypothetical protein
MVLGQAPRKDISWTQKAVVDAQAVTSALDMQSRNRRVAKRCQAT